MVSDGIDADLQIDADFSKSQSEAERLSKEFRSVVDSLQKSKKFSADLTQSFRALSNQTTRARKDMQQAVKALQLGARNNIREEVNRATVSSTRNRVQGSDEATRLKLLQEQLRLREQQAAVGAKIFRTNDAELQINQRLKLSSEQRLRFQRQLARIGDLSARGDQKSLRAAAQELKTLRQQLRAEKQKTKEIQRQNQQRTRNNRTQPTARGEGPANIFAPENIKREANLFQYQAKLLLNFKLITAAYSSAQFITDFIIQLDKAFFNLQAITKTTDSEMIKLKDSLLDAAAATKFTAVEVAEAAVVLGQAGFSAAEIEESIESVSLLATATGTTLSEAVQVATWALNVFGLQARQMSDVANLMTAAVNESKLTIQQLTLGVQYAANIAADSNVPLSELVASFGVLADAGIKSGSTLGTGVRQLLNDLKDPSEKLIVRLNELGLSFDDIDIRSQGLTGALSNLKAAGFTTTDALQTMEVRASAAFAALSRGVDTIEQTRQQFILSDAAIQANETQMKSLSNTFANFQSIIGGVFAEGLEPFTRALQGMLETINETIQEFEGLTKAVQYLALGITTILGLGFSVWLSKIAAQVFALKTLWTGLVGTFAFVVKWTAALATGIATLVPALAAATFAAAPLVLAVAAVAAAIAGGAYAFGLFDESTESLEDQLDKSTEAFNNAESEVEKYQTQINQASKFLTDMSRKSGRLRSDQSALTTQILEAQQAFRGLGGAVITAAESYETLFDKIVQIRNYAIEQQAVGLQLQLAEETKRFDLVKENADNAFAEIASAADQTRQDNRRELGFNATDQQRRALTEYETDVFKTLQGEGSREDRIAQLLKLNREFLDEFKNDLPKAVVDNIKALSDTAQAEIPKILQSRADKLSLDQTRLRTDGAQLLNQNKDQVNAIVESVLKANNVQEILVEQALTPEALKGILELYASSPGEAREELRAEFPQTPEGNVAFEQSLRILEPALQRFTESLSKYTDQLEFIEEENFKVRKEGIKTRKDLLKQEVREADTAPTKRQIEQYRQLVAETNNIKRQEFEVTQKETRKKLQGRSEQYIASLLEKRQRQFEANLRQKANLDLKQFINTNQDRAERLREIDARLDDDFQTVLDKLIIKFEDFQRNLQIEKVQPVQLQLEREQAVLDSFDNPENLGRVTESDRVAQQEKVRQLEIKVERTEISALSDELSGLRKQRERVVQERVAQEVKFEQALNNAQKAVNNDDRRRYSQEAQQAKQELQAATQEEIKLDRQIKDTNFELERRRVILQEQNSSRTSTIGTDFFDKILERYRQSIGGFRTVTQTIEQTVFAGIESMTSGFDNLFFTIFTGTKSAGQAFKDFGQTIIQEMLRIVTRALAMKFLEIVAGAFGFPSTGVQGFAKGGEVYSKPIGPSQTSKPGFFGLAEGGYISGGRPNRDSVPAMLMPGEYVLNKKAVETIGKDTLHLLNNGLRGTQKSASQIQPVSSGANTSQPKMVNVYVVNKEGMPPVGPDDVIATVGDNISRGGSLKRLIKSVVLT